MKLIIIKQISPYDKFFFFLSMTCNNGESLFVGPCPVSYDFCGKYKECNINPLRSRSLVLDYV